eukprot:85494-Chlamydomonas_euryale.AAC.1
MPSSAHVNIYTKGVHTFINVSILQAHVQRKSTQGKIHTIGICRTAEFSAVCKHDPREHVPGVVVMAKVSGSVSQSASQRVRQSGAYTWSSQPASE